MPDNLPMHGRHKETPREVMRTTLGRSQDWLFPDKETLGEIEDRPGTLVCPTCHAISLEKRWFLDEALYERLRADPETTVVACPGCLQVERGMYDGLVQLTGSWLAGHKSEILNLIQNTESKARQTNPFSRVGVTNDQGDRLELHVTTQWLAERIGKELHKAYKGELSINHLKGASFSRVRWHRD